MVAGDTVSIRGQVMEYTHIPIGIKRELVYMTLCVAVHGIPAWGVNSAPQSSQFQPQDEMKHS